MAIMPWQRLYSPAATIASLFCNRARVIDPVDPTVQSKVMMTMMVVDLMMVVMVVTVVMVVMVFKASGSGFMLLQFKHSGFRVF